MKKVSEDKFTKVKERQERKLNSLINKTSNSKNNGIRSTGSNNNLTMGWVIITKCKVQQTTIKRAIPIVINGS